MVYTPQENMPVCSRQAQFHEQEARYVVEVLSVLIFRLATAWLALPTSVCQEVAEKRAIHTLPHRRGSMVLGVVNIRGELRVCVSLSQCLGFAPVPAAHGLQNHHAEQRLLVVARASDQWVLLVDEIHGIVEFPADAVQPIPVSTAGALPQCATGRLAWQSKEVQYLDPTHVFVILNSAML